MRVAIGVTGGVAAYKAAELVRRLQQEGLEVEAILTRHAQEFITPLTFAALTGRKVITDMFSVEDSAPANVESAIEHIAVAQRIDCLVIAPATANTIAKLAQGIADDFLTTLYLATTAPVVIAPAMNVNMWEHAATQANLETLRLRGARIVAPDEGYLACGMVGAGRLAGVEAIAQGVFDVLGVRHDLADETLLVTAGPTQEDIDPVRYLTNRSSGKMGYALAEAARRRGAKVILVSGPVALDAPEGIELMRVRTADEVHRAVRERLHEATAVIMAAAVADFRPSAPQAEKIKRGRAALSLELAPTADILADIARDRFVASGKSQESRERLIVGFAAETQNVAEHARAKLAAKRADMIVANDVTREGAGFDVNTNIVTLFFREGPEVELPKMSKLNVAHRVLDELLRLRQQQVASHPSSSAPPSRANRP
ncbi:MAG TPA: bifunctional phosphopantothenoylcysteine decarboxylase/phosphopantothenate--cysteine ligase CoaBC [Candidatus Acidoferrales bacterium]|nr:bifunctional phosphopantothenoylcysteine decarboxylase/phosphopantothenate--cysteine ligase CoaBC [Candidatus Acidoferrales bacterium]